MIGDVMQSLWIGRRLSSMEVLSIESFLHFGYEYHLYVYDEVANVPRGVTLRDANEILPASEIFYFQGDFAPGSPACFSDIWRYKLLLDKGHWWVDTDVVCVRPFDFASEHVVGHQREQHGHCVNSAVIRAPAGSPLARFCFEACLRMDREKLLWGSTGPKLVQAAIRELGMDDCIQPPEAFYDVDYWEFGQLFAPRELSANARSVHLWQAMWKDRGIAVEGPFPSDSLYERLRRRFLPNYESPDLSEHESERIAARLVRATSPARGRSRRRTRRLLHTVLPWSRAA